VLSGSTLILKLSKIKQTPIIGSAHNGPELVAIWKPELILPSKSLTEILS